MALIEPIDPQECGPAARRALETVPPSSVVFRIAAHADSAFAPWLALQGELMGTLTLDSGLRELAILRVAAVTGCEYERVHHEVVAILDGVTQGQVDAIAAGRIEGPEFDPGETLVLRLVSEVVAGNGAPAETVEQVLELLSPRELVELLLVVSHYHGLALMINSLGLEAEPPVDPAAVLETRRRRAAAAAGASPPTA